MTIVRCDASHEALWSAFVISSPGATIYHRWAWREINEQHFGHQTAFLAAIEDGRVVGVFPMVRLKSVLFGSVACSMPFVNYGGPCCESDTVERALLEAAEGIAADWQVDYLEIRSRHRLNDRYPCSEHKVSMAIGLDPNPDVVMNAFKREQRAEIRRAAKNGFVARFGPEMLDDFYAVLSESWRDLGTPIYRIGYFRSILAAFPDATRVCVIYDAEGRPAAGAFDGIHNGIVEGMWLGMRSEYRRQLVGYVLYWELIKHACELGCHSFHLGRSSKDSGGEQFKKKWNATALQLYWHYVLRTRSTIPDLNPSNPKYALAIRAWQRLPVSVSQALGPLVACSIP